jgi:hypothetical protein
MRHAFSRRTLVLIDRANGRRASALADPQAATAGEKVGYRVVIG